MISHQQAKLKITRVKQPDSLVHRLPFSGKLNKAAMATFSIGFTSSQVFVMLSVATYIMLTAAGCNRTIGREIHNNLTNIVSYTLLLVNIAKLCTISHRCRNRGGGGTGGMCPPMFHKLLYKLLTTLCVVSGCAPPPPPPPPPPIKKSFLCLC